MNEVAIRVEKLGKRYFIAGRQERYVTLRDTMTDILVSPFRRANYLLRGQAYGASELTESIWALKDISFEIKHGEVVGIIGRNGAGKSTLLKILSRITEPSEGYVDVYGRVRALLEVGTGFHPELTGRENVYLNGAILGMKRHEIEQKFDEIVDFAGIDQFIDTPVKHYSSGMGLRLGFAVAAHLEPEILLVDEVLAVGDLEFQKRCLGKMTEVATSGRTVLFVSHNMQAIQALCNRVVWLEGGQVRASDTALAIVMQYLASSSNQGNEISWDEATAPGNDEIKLMSMRVYSESGTGSNVFSSKDDLYVEIGFQAKTIHSALCVGFDLMTIDGVVVARSYQTDMSPERSPQACPGYNLWRCVIPKGLLNAGVFVLSPRISLHNLYWIVNSDPVIQFEVILDHGVSSFWNSLTGQTRPGVISPILPWNAI